jgi:hypothetical protein
MSEVFLLIKARSTSLHEFQRAPQKTCSAPQHAHWMRVLHIHHLTTGATAAVLHHDKTKLPAKNSWFIVISRARAAEKLQNPILWGLALNMNARHARQASDSSRIHIKLYIYRARAREISAAHKGPCAPQSCRTPRRAGVSVNLNYYWWRYENIDARR